MNHIIFFSGGKSSFVVAHLVKEKYPNDNIVLYFTDTKWEDEDLYRFIEEGSDKLQLPLLIQSKDLTPLQIMFDEQFIYNSRVGNCSKKLKMQVSDDYLKKGKIPKIHKWHNKQYLKDDDFISGATLYFGIGFMESHRMTAIEHNWKPFKVEFPLVNEFVDDNGILEHYKIDIPRLYLLNFSHNNCKGRCVKAGQGHFKNLLEKDPETFYQLEQDERVLNSFITQISAIKGRISRAKKYQGEIWEDELKRAESDYDFIVNKYRDYFYGDNDQVKKHLITRNRFRQYAFMKKTKDNKTSAYRLQDLRDDLNQSCKIDDYDIGGCGCFVE